MLALTVHQPWASLIAAGVKRIEIRSWRTRHRGPLAIHASRRAPDPALCQRFGLDPDQLPRGAIVAVVDVVDSRPVAPADGPDACCAIVIDRDFGWIFGRVTGLPAPVACSGRQRLWPVPGRIAIQVGLQLAARKTASRPDSESRPKHDCRRTTRRRPVADPTHGPATPSVPGVTPASRMT